MNKKDVLGLTTQQKRNKLIDMAYGEGTPESQKRVVNIFANLMTDAEINAVYDFIFNYIKKGVKVPQGSSLFYQIQAIGSKYEIFT